MHAWNFLLVFKTNLPLQALDLIDKLLTLDPVKRPSAEQALMHDFFFEEPMAGDLSELFEKYPDSSFFEFLTPRNPPDRHAVNLFPSGASSAQKAASVSGASTSQAAGGGAAARRLPPGMAQQQQQQLSRRQKDQQLAFEQAF